MHTHTRAHSHTCTQRSTPARSGSETEERLPAAQRSSLRRTARRTHAQTRTHTRPSATKVSVNVTPNCAGFFIRVSHPGAHSCGAQRSGDSTERKRGLGCRSSTFDSLQAHFFYSPPFPAKIYLFFFLHAGFFSILQMQEPGFRENSVRGVVVDKAGIAQ